MFFRRLEFSNLSGPSANSRAESRTSMETAGWPLERRRRKPIIPRSDGQACGSPAGAIGSRGYGSYSRTLWKRPAASRHAPIRSAETGRRGAAPCDRPQQDLFGETHAVDGARRLQKLPMLSHTSGSIVAPQKPALHSSSQFPHLAIVRYKRWNCHAANHLRRSKNWPYTA